MPTYDYQCDNCGDKFEEFQAITAEPVSICKLCGNGPVKRLISGGAGFVLQGGGWYKDGYGDKAPAKTETKPSEHKPADPAKATETKTYKKD